MPARGEAVLADSVDGESTETAPGRVRRLNLDCLWGDATYNSSLRWSTLCVEGWPFFFPGLTARGLTSRTRASSVQSALPSWVKDGIETN